MCLSSYFPVAPRGTSLLISRDPSSYLPVAPPSSYHPVAPPPPSRAHFPIWKVHANEEALLTYKRLMAEEEAASWRQIAERNAQSLSARRANPGRFT